MSALSEPKSASTRVKFAISRAEAARRLGASNKAVLRLIAAGRLRTIQFPGCLPRIVQEDVDRLIAEVNGES